MEVYALVRYSHVAAGVVALAAYWTAALLRKGSRNHRRTGQAYLLAMTVVLVSALPLASRAFANGKPVTGMFLVFLSAITATACWQAWRAIRDRRDFGRYTGRIYGMLAWVNMVCGAVVLGFGIRYQVLLLAVFSLVGLLGGFFMLRVARSGATDAHWWIREHYGAVIGCGVATHIAFLNLGLQRLVPGDYGTLVQNAAFIGPLALAFVARAWLNRKYGRGALSSGMHAPASPASSQGSSAARAA